MSLSNNLIKSEIYSTLELKEGKYYLKDTNENENEKMKYLTNREYDKKELNEEHYELINTNVASYKLTGFQHKVIEYLASQDTEIVKVDNTDFLNAIDFHREVYQNSASTNKYNKEFLELAITRIFLSKNEKGEEVRYAIQPLSFKITTKRNGNKSLEVALNPFLRRDLKVGYQNLALSKDEDYNRFLMLLKSNTLDYTKPAFVITSTNLAYSILKVKEHLRTKGNRNKKILEILELFARENNDRKIAFIKLKDNEEVIVYFTKYLPYKKTDIKETYFKNGAFYG